MKKRGCRGAYGRFCVRMPARRLLPVLLCAVMLCAVGALRVDAATVQTTIRALVHAYSFPLTTWHVNGTTEGTVDIRSERNPVVRARLQLKATLLSNGLGVPSSALPVICSGENALGRLCFDVPRADIRLRIPITDDYRLRFTVGRTRLTWGQGQLFNAGDLIFGAEATSTDFTQSTLRDETANLLAIFIPITDLTFLETVILPPTTLLVNAPLGHSSAGLRLQGKIANGKYELGYLYNGAAAAHNVALSIQGNLGIDMYLSATSAFVHDADLVDELYNRLQITFGLNHTARLSNNVSMNARLESLWRPSAHWQEGEGVTRYALLLYPEISLSIQGNTQLFIRSLFSPIDLSAQIIGGVVWQPYTGLSILFFPSVNVGEKSDLFHLDQVGGVRVSIGAEYAF